MLQRIQSLFLFLAFTLCVLAFFFPFADFVLDGEMGYYFFSLTGLRDAGPGQAHLFNWVFSLPLWLLNSMAGFLCIYIIFQYKNRAHQLKMLRISILITILLIGFIFYYAASLIEKKLGMTPHYRMGIYFPLLAVLFQILANRAISRDDKLVRSADRLR